MRDYIHSDIFGAFGGDFYGSFRNSPLGAMLKKQRTASGSHPSPLLLCRVLVTAGDF